VGEEVTSTQSYGSHRKFYHVECYERTLIDV
jgi:hypothetical protein